MALDLERAQAQQEKLRRAADEVWQLQKDLRTYRQQLNQAWSADEVSYFNRTIDDLSARCAKLEQSMHKLGRDIQQAVEDIREEEAQEEAARQTEG